MDITLLINSCDKFSDLWEIQCSLLAKNWGDRNCRTILLTDKPTDFKYDNIEVISAGAGMEMVDRMRSVMTDITTDFVFVSLDDYFLVQPVENTVIKSLLETMSCESLDYIRLYKFPKLRDGIDLKSNKNVKLLQLHQNYDVNLYPGIWRKEFLCKTLAVTGIDAWKFEVTLTKTAREVNARCAVYVKECYIFLDAVRKGRFLHRAARFIKTYGHYNGNRKLVPYIEEWKLLGMRTLNAILPDNLRKRLKCIMKKCGMKFYSED